MSEPQRQLIEPAPSSAPLIVYGPRSSLLDANARGRLKRELAAAVALGWRFALRDIVAPHRQSLLGWIWVILTPLLASLPFIFLNSQNILAFDGSIPYPLYVVAGSAFWLLFVEAVNLPDQALTASGGLNSRVSFPREALLLSAALQTTVNFCLKLVVVTALMIAYGFGLRTPPLALMFAFACVLVAGVGIGLILVPLTSLFRDAGKALTLALGLLFFVTPVIHAPAQGTLLARLAAVNPVAPLIVTGREALLGQPLSALPECAVAGAAAVVLALCGWVVFRISLPFIIERA